MRGRIMRCIARTPWNCEAAQAHHSVVFPAKIALFLPIYSSQGILALICLGSVLQQTVVALRSQAL